MCERDREKEKTRETDSGKGSSINSSNSTISIKNTTQAVEAVVEETIEEGERERAK